MKKIAVILLGILMTQVVAAQIPFKVITVNGEIVATKAKVTLQNGLEVKSDEQFEFVKPHSRAALINSDYGRVVLTEASVADAFSKAAFAPAISTVSSRGINLTTLSDLKSFFTGDFLIIDELRHRIDPLEFPMNDQKYFFVRYDYNGEVVNKRLDFDKNNLIFNVDQMLTVDGKKIGEAAQITKMTLYYYDSTKKTPESILINTITPVFIKTDDIRSEIAMIMDVLKEKPYEVITSEVYDYLNTFYGFIDKEPMEHWFKQHFPNK